ncbi:hypothetical protein QAD02_015523 [Eretmocerus hayati]|uniref:Uncharacterized protein n=1 Tax=Eretmocerus hayati TaxID=131215 RepID=A0ACC2PA57_9HYME|nr:hypothetical protein QAD02_015523 [Eretmocerus hayati]
MVNKKPWLQLGTRQKRNRCDQWLCGVIKKSEIDTLGQWEAQPVGEPVAAVIQPSPDECQIANDSVNITRQVDEHDSRARFEDEVVPAPISDPQNTNEDEDDESDWTSDEEDDGSENFLNELKERRKFEDKLAEVLDHSVPREKCEALLKLLREQGGKFESLPVRISTLRKSSRIKVPIRECLPGKYVHYGLRKCLEEEIARHGLEHGELLEMDLNIDGLKLKRTSTEELWPILGRLVIRGRKTKPFIIGVYYGRRKPKSVKSYLKDLAESANNCHYSFKLRNIIADNPARSYIKCCG